jgi:N4-gp56 family major capsid protein
MSSTTGGLTNLMSTFYDKKFLERAKLSLVMDFGAQVKRLPRNAGSSVKWNRFTPLAVATTALTEGTSNPSAVDMTTTVVSATVQAFGNWVQVADLFNLTSIDENLTEHVDVMGQNAGESIDTLIRNELSGGGTTQLAGAKAALTDIAATDVFSGAEIRKAVRTLKANKAMRFESGLFRGITNERSAYDLFNNTEWLNSVSIYTDPTQIKQGVIGKLHGVEFVETNNGKTEASTVTVYHNYIFGKNAYGTVALDGQEGSRIYVKVPRMDDGNTENPLNIYSTIGWKAFFQVKVLNSAWLINVKTGATA